MPPAPCAAVNSAVPGDPGLPPSATDALQQPETSPLVRVKATKIVRNNVSEVGTQLSPTSVPWGHPSPPGRTIRDNYGIIGSIIKKNHGRTRHCLVHPSHPYRLAGSKRAESPRPSRDVPWGSAPVNGTQPQSRSRRRSPLAVLVMPVLVEDRPGAPRQARSKLLCCLANCSMVSSSRIRCSRSYCSARCHFRL